MYSLGDGVFYDKDGGIRYENSERFCDSGYCSVGIIVLDDSRGGVSV